MSLLAIKSYTDEVNFKKNRTLLISAGIVIVSTLGIYIAWNAVVPNNFRCPNEYGTAEQYVTGVTEWASGQLTSSPNMTKEELLSERQRLFKEHNCESSHWPNLPGGL